VAKPRALVIGGTGPTGPFVVEGLHERGYEVTILHGGQHEVEFAVAGVRHIHEDPHFREGLERGIGEETFELVVAQYGRLRIVADVFAGRTERLIAVGGATALFAPDGDERWGPAGRPALFPDDSEIYVRDAGPDGANKIGLRMVEAMESVFEHHAAGSYSATYIGYPLNYGPRTPGPYDWSVIRRVLDGRRSFAIADGGLKLDSRIYTANAAAAVLLAVDEGERAAGRRYSVADESAFTMRQRIELIGRHLGHELELVDMPYEVAWPCHPLWRHVRGHRLTQSGAIRAELGYRDPVQPGEAMATTIDWLLANRPEPGGELERQIADPFDYAREDELLARWRGAREALGEIDAQLPAQGHQYRHPKTAGEAWRAPAAKAPGD
jgi:nucleoside-diphosphate-sugar epimerase